MSIFQIAKNRLTDIVETLPAIETALASAFDRPSISEAEVELVIESTWLSLVEEAQLEGVTYDYAFVHSVFAKLIEAAHVTEYTANQDESPPWEPENGRVDIDNLCIIYWDRTFPIMSLTLGWTCMNLFRLDRGLPIIVPNLSSLPDIVDGMYCAEPPYNDGVALEGLLERFATAEFDDA